MAMIETYRGGVETWECDLNNHLNVKFYVAHAVDGLVMLGHALGLGSVYVRDTHKTLSTREHHIRFYSEQRPGSPLVMQTGILQINGTDSLRVYQEMRNIASDSLVATFISECQMIDLRNREAQPLPDGIHERSQAFMTELPEHGAPRGITVGEPRPTPTLNDADRLGMALTYRNLLGHSDCDRDGFMKTSGYMACISSAVPVMISATRGMLSRDKRIGGAALEYRLLYHKTPRLGDQLILRSGLTSVGSKTFGWGHWLFDGDSGDYLAGAEAVAVMLDLIARKAISIPEDMHDELSSQVISELSI